MGPPLIDCQILQFIYHFQTEILLTSKICNFEALFCMFVFNGKAKYIREKTFVLPFLHTNHSPSFPSE